MVFSLFYEPDDFYINCKDLLDSENGGVAVARGWTVKKLDVVNRKAFLEDDYAIDYQKCLIATGSIPKNLPVFEGQNEKITEKVILYRNIHDFEYLYETVKDSDSIAIVGGGFLGSELACALSRKGKIVSTQVRHTLCSMILYC